VLRELGYDEAHIAALKQAGEVTGSAGTTTASSPVPPTLLAPAERDHF
jgi:hypothetical protein